MFADKLKELGVPFAAKGDVNTNSLKSWLSEQLGLKAGSVSRMNYEDIPDFVNFLDTIQPCIKTKFIGDKYVKRSIIYDEVEGQGFENMGADKYSVPRLKIAQPTSGVLTEDNTKVKVGDFYNSVTGESYGSEIEVIPVYFNTVWLEWKPNMGGLAGRHKPYSVRVTGDVFTGLKTLDGNDIQESW